MEKIRCALCLEEKDPKSNTHYLTNYVIKRTLNFNGDKRRDYGLYFNLDSQTPYIDVSIERNAPTEKIEDIIGRSFTEEEICRSIQRTSFSVNNKFCSDCEVKFTSIETSYENIYNFINKKEIQDHLSPIELYSNLISQNKKITKLFFLLQLWRTHICVEEFNLDDEIAENLRRIIYDDSSIESLCLSDYTIHVDCYNFKDDEDYTSGFVGFVTGKDPHIINMGQYKISYYFCLDQGVSKIFKYSKRETQKLLCKEAKNITISKIKFIEQKISENLPDNLNETYIPYVLYILCSFMTITEESYLKAINLFSEELNNNSHLDDIEFINHIKNKYKK